MPVSKWYSSFIDNISLFCTLLIRKVKKHNKPTGEWHYIGKLQEVNFDTEVGIISCPPDLVNIEVECNDNYGRQFVLMDSNGELMFPWKYTKIHHIEATMIDDNRIEFTAPNVPPLVINIHSEFLEPLSMQTKKIKELRKRLVRLQLLEGDAEQHKWFSKFILGTASGVRLFMNLKPIVDKRWLLKVSYGLTVLHKKSLEDFNSRLPKRTQIVAKEFSDNIVIDTTTVTNIKAYDEDHWYWIRIGEDNEQSAILRFNEYCYSSCCHHINTRTIVENKELQTIFDIVNTLKPYRRIDKADEYVFGSSFIFIKPGPIKPNSNVYMQFASKNRQLV